MPAADGLRRSSIAQTRITVAGGKLTGIEIDMNAISDTVQTLAAVALFAEGPTTITGVAHIRHKETDRINALAAELRKFGAEVEELRRRLQITPANCTPPDRHLRRSSHGDEHGLGRTEGRAWGSKPRMHREDVSEVFRGSGKAEYVGRMLSVRTKY